jgi:hypothetical protein
MIDDLIRSPDIAYLGGRFLIGRRVFSLLQKSDGVLGHPAS